MVDTHSEINIVIVVSHSSAKYAISALEYMIAHYEALK